MTKEDDNLIETKLSIPDGWNITEEERYVYAFHNNQSPKLKPNQLSIYLMEAIEYKDKLIVTGLLRSTIPKPIELKQQFILLLDEKRKAVARKKFDLSKLGILSPNRARPWKFAFDMSQIIKEDMNSFDNWSLAFEVNKQQHKLELDDAWKYAIDDTTKSALDQIVKDAPQVKTDEINLLGVNAELTDDHDLVTTLLIRNGMEQNLSIKHIELGFKDASGEEIARGTFTLENLIVNSNTSKPWSFKFPASKVKKKDIDLTEWEVYIVQ